MISTEHTAPAGTVILIRILPVWDLAPGTKRPSPDLSLALDYQAAIDIAAHLSEAKEDTFEGKEDICGISRQIF